MSATRQCDDCQKTSAVPDAFYAGLHAIAGEGKMLRSRWSSSNGDWQWESIPTGHKMVGTVRTMQEIGPDVFISVWELDTTGRPVRAFSECSRSDLVCFEELDTADTTGNTVRKWSAERGQMKCHGEVVPSALATGSIPDALCVDDGAALLDPYSIDEQLAGRIAEYVRRTAEARGSEAATGDAWRETLVEDLRAALDVFPNPLVSDADDALDAPRAAPGLTMAAIERQRQDLSRDFHRDFYNSEYLRVRALDEDLLGPAPPPAE